MNTWPRTVVFWRSRLSDGDKRCDVLSYNHRWSLWKWKSSNLVVTGHLGNLRNAVTVIQKQMCQFGNMFSKLFQFYCLKLCFSWVRAFKPFKLEELATYLTIILVKNLGYKMWVGEKKPSHYGIVLNCLLVQLVCSKNSKSLIIKTVTNEFSMCWQTD